MRTVLILVVAFLHCGCNREIKDEDVFTDLLLSPSELPADGQSTSIVSVKVNDAASSDRRSFVFSTTAGTFTASGNGKFTAKAEYENGVLMAKAILRAPFSPGEFTLTVQPEFGSPIRDFVLSRIGKATPSLAASIELETSGFGIASNFLNEIFLSASLRNATGKNVSKGTSVIFEDELLTGGPARGRFRYLQSTTSDSSKVSGYYSAPAYPIGTNIKIRSTVLDALGQKTNIVDSILININQ